MLRMSWVSIMPILLILPNNFSGKFSSPTIKISSKLCDGPVIHDNL
jgi:hypothetical protein